MTSQLEASPQNCAHPPPIRHNPQTQPTFAIPPGLQPSESETMLCLSVFAQWSGTGRGFSPVGVNLMSKVVLSLVFAVALVCAPAVALADCGCGAPAAPCCQAQNDCGCCRKPTRLKLERVQKEVTRCERVCVTDECGRTRVERVPVTKCVTRVQLVRVPKEPRRGRCCESSCNGCSGGNCGCGCN